MVELLSKVMCVVALRSPKNGLRTQPSSRIHTYSGARRTFRLVWFFFCCCSSLGKLIHTHTCTPSTYTHAYGEASDLCKTSCTTAIRSKCIEFGMEYTIYGSTNSHQYTVTAKTDKRHTKKRSGKRQRRSSHVMLYETSAICE